MFATTILECTASGKTARKRGGLSADETILLGLLDGESTVARLIGDGGELLKGDFLLLAQGLQQRGLLRQLNAPPAKVSDELAIDNENIWSEARRAARTLEEKGFYTHLSKLIDTSLVVKTSGLRALVVEDDDDLADLLTVLLEDQGFLVTRVADAPPALEALQNGPEPDLVLLDVVLPTSNGFDILARIRRYTRLHDVPVVMVTSRISDEDVVRGLKAGADGYIFKPFQWETLYASIQSVIAGR